MELGELRKKAKALEPIVRIGKGGLSESMIDEIKRHLKVKKLIKVKLLKNFIYGKDKKEIIDDIVNQTESILVEKKGFVIVIHKK